MAEETETTSGGINFTDGESKLIMAIMSNLTSDIQFDAETVAKQLGYKDGGIVKTRWRQIKAKKLIASDGTPVAGIKKRSPNKKKAAAEAGEGGDDEEEASTPKTPKKRAPRKKKASEEKVEEESEDGGEGVKEEEVEA